jgi:hypothetical protein
MSHKGLKSRRPGLLPDEENGKCGIAKYGAEFPSIGNYSPKRMRTKPEQNIITGVVIVGMVANALLCDRGGLMLSRRKLCLHPPRFWITGTMEGQQVAEV